MLGKIEKISISPEIMEKTNLTQEQKTSVEEKLSTLMPFDSFLDFSDAWQLELATGEKNYYLEHKLNVDKHNNNICDYAIIFSNIDVLDWLKQWNEHLLKYTLNEHYYYFVQTANTAILDWVWEYDKTFITRKINSFSFSHGAAYLGKVSILEWIKINMKETLNELDEKDRASIMHYAATSENQEALAFCYNFNPELRFVLDSKNKNYIDYAVETGNPNQINYALSLSETPEVLNVKLKGLPGGFKMATLEALDQALDNNITLQSISYNQTEFKDDYKDLVHSIQNKLNINMVMNAYNVAKPVFFLLTLAVKDHASPLSSLNKDLYGVIATFLFNIAIPEQKAYLVNSTLFGQSLKKLDYKHKETALNLKDCDAVREQGGISCS